MNWPKKNFTNILLFPYYVLVSWCFRYWVTFLPCYLYIVPPLWSHQYACCMWIIKSRELSGAKCLFLTFIFYNNILVWCIAFHHWPSCCIKQFDHVSTDEKAEAPKRFAPAHSQKKDINPVSWNEVSDNICA